ncbi:hypothetical protein AB0I82_25355 [Streptomyces sp. NPDC050315]|uniref:hypothetical protein n=1 Tax=Streptomyces sp. NPDC050315 TaxID=3155039 RepID=UPI0034487A79
MQRRSSVRGAAVAAAVALATILTSCSGSSDTDAGAEDAKGGGSTSSAPVAEPGEFDSLPEPCGLPARRTLRSLLPTDGTPETPEEADKVYRGRADITFDTDRRVGCHWKRETSEGTRHLNIDLQRVVSYDGSVSDDDKAQELYAKKELAAHIPSDTATGTPTSPASKGSSGKPDEKSDGTPDEKASGEPGQQSGADTGARSGAEERGTRPSGGKGPAADPSAGTADREKAGTSETAGSTAGNTAGNTPGKGSGTRTDESASPGSAGSSGAPDPSGSPSSTSPDDAASLAPRPLGDLGDAAFLDDALVTADSGLHRDITVVFRSSNVIVTIEYDQWSTDKSVLPDRRELQEKARALAAELAAHWTE